MGGFKTRVIFIGPDCGGKSTLAKLLAEELDIPISAHRKPKTDMELLATVTTDAMMLEDGLTGSFIRDQWPFPVDILYSYAMSDEFSPLYPLGPKIAAAHNKADVIFIYVTATMDEITSRFNKRGDELWDLEQIKKVARVYEDFWNLNQYELNIIRVDTTGYDPNDQVKYLLDAIDDVHQRLEDEKNDK